MGDKYQFFTPYSKKKQRDLQIDVCCHLLKGIFLLSDQILLYFHSVLLYHYRYYSTEDIMLYMLYVHM